MKKLFLLAIFLSLGGWVGIGLATPEPKVFVCKYVGTPGVNETLQTGQNPISVSQNAIKDFAGIGSYFNDEHGRSLVVAFDTGQDEPECPVPQNNPPKEETPPTSQPTPSNSTPVETSVPPQNNPTPTSGK